MRNFVLSLAMSLAWASAVAQQPGVVLDEPPEAQEDHGMERPTTHETTAFEGSELLVGRGMKVGARAKTFEVGVDIRFVPMDLALKSLQDKAIEAAIDEACKGDAQCQTTARQGWDKLRDLEDEQWQDIQSFAEDPSRLELELQKVGLSADQAKDVTRFIEQVPKKDRASAVTLARKVSEPKLTVMLEPYGLLNFKPIEIKFSLPLVINRLEGSSEAALGNLGVEARFAHHFDLGIGHFGLGGGLELRLPTGTDEANLAALGDLYRATRYTNSYLSVEPYLVLGLDIPFVTVQASAGIVSQHKVRGNPAYSSVQYGKYAAGLSLFPKLVLSVFGELDGMFPINDASSYNALFGLGGLRFNLWILQLYLAVQTPIYNNSMENLPMRIGNVPIDRLARLTLLFRGAFVF